MTPTDPSPAPAVALLAGAQTPAGSAIASSLAEAGWHVAALDGDVADAPAVTDAYNKARANGPVTLLVCAQEPEDASPLPIEQTPLERLRRAVDVQLRGTQNACRAVLPEMLERGSGNIVAVIGADALTGRRTSDASAAAGSVLGLIRALAREVGPKGVQVNAVAAGTLGSTAHLPQDEQPPIGRGLAPEEVAGTVTWLASERHYFAGTVLSPAGGALL